MHIVCDTNKRSHFIALIVLCIFILALLAFIVVIDYRLFFLTEKITANLELQQTTADLLKQSATTQNSVLKAMGIVVDYEMPAQAKITGVQIMGGK